MGLSYVAVWPKVSVHIDGEDVVVDRGRPVPAKLDDGIAALLQSLGAIAVVEPTSSASTDTAATAVPAGTEQAAPARSASKGKWVDYAVSQGMSPGEATSKTKDELADLYLGPKDGDEDPDGGDDPDGTPAGASS